MHTFLPVPNLSRPTKDGVLILRQTMNGTLKSKKISDRVMCTYLEKAYDLIRRDYIYGNVPQKVTCRECVAKVFSVACESSLYRRLGCAKDLH